MAHELTIRDNGMAEMAYLTGDAKPWHGLGQELQADATKQEWVEAAGFNWTVEATVPQFETAEGTMSIDDRRVLYRSDNCKHLSIVSDRFKIVQPVDIMNYFDELARRAGFKMDTAGTLFGGRQFWGLASIGDTACVADPRDQVKGRLLMATSVDLSLPTTLKFLAERVVCHNTLTYGLSEKGGTTVKVRHSTDFSPDKVNTRLGIVAHERFAAVMDDFRKMAGCSVDNLLAMRATTELVNPSAHEMSLDDLVKVVNSRPVQRICELAIDHVDAIGSGLAGVRGTAWGWLNAVTQFVDHESRSTSADTRLSRAWFSDGDKLKSRAFSLATSISEGDDMFMQQYKKQGAHDLFAEVLST